jgi:hypothetical protein
VSLSTSASAIESDDARGAIGAWIKNVEPRIGEGQGQTQNQSATVANGHTSEENGDRTGQEENGDKAVQGSSIGGMEKGMGKINLQT